MNFTELYQRIRSIDEGTASEPTAPGGVIKTKNADGSVSYKPKVPGERLTSTLPANQAANEPTAPGGVIKTKNADGSVSYKPKVPGERLTSTLPATQAAKTTDKTDNTKKEPATVNETRSDYTAQEMADILSGKKSQKQVDDEAEKTRGPDKNAKKVKEQQLAEECGGMPVGMMGMSSPQGQQDSVTMNISMNGSGAGGIRDLMSILRNIESSDNTDVHSHDVSKLFGGDDIEVAFDEEMSDGGFGAASTTPDPTVSGIDAVTDIGAPINGGDHRKRQAGLPQGAPMHETLVNRLSALYNEIKEAKEEEFDALKHVKNPTKGEKEAAKDVKRGSYADRAAMLKSAETDGRLKKEAYNPNSVDAEHRRGLEKSQEDSLKKKAADGDESAKKRLQALKDKKERMRNDYNDRMER